ncbi:MAG TPA: c-type cytochrome [Vicinamibacteria bacterium]|nr:c-type cytochrome [Vicinamibacteria bacterium]
MRRNKLLLLVSSLGALLLLVFAAFEENVLREWRRIQKQARADSGPIEVRLRQVVVPPLGIADRCVSCHVGMAPGEQGMAGHPALRAHPDVPHDPATFGCTTCHAGQGRATDRNDAHGDVPFWPEPMIPRRYADAGCGSCHTHVQVPNLARLQEGRRAVERAACLDCHSLDGRGGTTRPGDATVAAKDLSRLGATGYRADWYEDHERRRAESAADSAWRTSFGPMDAGERAAIDVVLASSVGAPRLVESKALFHTLGCRGCHKVNGVGGDDGPDLTRVGEKDPGRLDMTRVPGRKDLADWHKEHLRAPAALVPGSAMPALGLSEAEIDSLTHYLFSLRRSAAPEAFWPKDRIRATRFGEREFATDGATLYGTFCAACHGPGGEGMRYPGLAAFPAIANPDFLSIASDEFVTATVTHGRPGRRMPAWGDKEGGLRPAEIAEVVRHVRKLGGGVAAEPDPRPRRWAGAADGRGARLYAMNCALCHGPDGQGGAEGPALRNAVLLSAASDTYLAETIRRGRRGTLMQGFATPTSVRPALEAAEVESIVSFIRTWEDKR